ncbi:hypothetical protein [Phenylobacterium sp.]|jgi:hypothetical protein|uniref:hypothetical protein n=1 Tax=Phenylobacterium sp. TaxID=1871053 RepID=UPI002F40C496
MRSLTIFLLLLLAPSVAWAQTHGLFEAPQGQLSAAGWAGFLDTRFMAESIGALLMATGLSVLIAYHPTTPRTVDTLSEADMPRVYILYAFIGAVIGVTVREFGMVVGVVVFGLGGLMRFRTDTASARNTGRLIIVTLVGLSCGLGLPHFAAITTLFAFVLIYLFDSRPICRVRISQLPPGRVGECAQVYRQVLEGQGCKIVGEHKSFAKDRIEFVFRLPRKGTREGLNTCLCEAPFDVRGEFDWEVE